MKSALFKLNGRSYPSNEYPLTHSIYLQNIRRRLSEKLYYIERIKIVIIIILGFSIFPLIYGAPIQMLNVINGPYHLNLQQFIKHVKNFKDGRYQLTQYIQVEIGENNIQNPINAYQKIKRYSDPRKRNLHIATYKTLKNPKIFIKLPTTVVKHFHTKFPFDFSLFSSKTLKCIQNVLLTKSDSSQIPYNEKVDILNYIDQDYTKNSTSFNMVVLTKCGILIGYLYSPLWEAAFLPTKKYEFLPKDIAFDMTQPYYSKYLLYFFSIIFCFPSIFFLIPYCLSFYKITKAIKTFEKNGFPFFINQKIEEELWVLNFSGQIHENLLKLDELIFQSKHKYETLTIIEHPKNGHKYVVIVADNLNWIENFETLSFMICPVTDIRLIRFEGIYFVNDKNVEICLEWSLIKLAAEEREEYAEWLHETLFEISENYRQKYQNEIQKWRMNANEMKEEKNKNLLKLINEEKNIRRLKNCRLSLYTYFSLIFSNNSSCRMTACFRLLEKINPNFVDDETTMLNEQCMICLDEFNLNDRYSKWPCASSIPHKFHYDCMSKWLRAKNQCPLCQQPAKFNI